MTICPHTDMNIPEDAPREVIDALMELFGGEELAGVIYSPDYKSLEVRQVVEGTTVVHSYVFNEETSHFDMVGYNPHANAKL